MTNEDIKKAMEEAKYSGCSPQIALYVILALFLLCSCSTKSLVETETQYQHLTEMMKSMDSLFHSTSTWQQSIFEKQTALVDSFKNSEVSDTSHTIFLGEKGDTVKEIIYTTKIIEREHNTSESTKESYQELYKQNEMLFQSTKILQEKVDSLLYEHNKTTVIEKKVPWYERWLTIVLSIVVLFLLCYIIYLRIFGKTSYKNLQR